MENTILTDEDAINHGFESQGYFSIGNSCAKKMKKQFIKYLIKVFQILVK
jgi:hypothetical protein